ncbi:adenylate/guanylate cyclase domain-containing protein [Alloyangia pacifica]|uniref:histidine kinase n=1 Tax=Alloyangia pacifica TaxID=311180 RepID=A0A1I6RFW3_9RHOB|nr:adenylate/guanylate cyclase domain-containing protein [Alloyangia pacifica]SDG49235.1 Response regulator receiver domain-containing protein [Alloyangia pacifica]SFS63565.1 Response regulator receiver domain-containing protein [Alloyangia pacifica]
MQDTPEDIRERALATRVIQRLAGPAEAIAGIQEIVLEEIRGLGLAEAAADAERVAMAARQLLALIGSAAQGGVVPSDRQRLRHDLRTPINAIIGYSELVAEDFEAALPEALLGDIRSVVGECALLLAQIDRVLGPDAEAGSLAGSALDGLVAASVARSLAAGSGVPQGEAGRVLVIDDTAENLDLMRRQLGRHGHEVTTAGSASEGLVVLARAEIDVILVDVLMPDMNGIELLARIKQNPRWRHIPIIVVSGLKDMRAVTRCIAAGAEDYLQRPVDPVLLHARVGSCLEKHRWHQRELRYLAEIEYERDRADAMLHAVLPAPVIARLRAGETQIADRVPATTIVFADIVGFTPWTARLDPGELLQRLTEIFLAFDDLAAQHGVEKIKTIGDAYMAASGVPLPAEDHAERALGFARAIVGDIARRTAGEMTIRVGLHSGPVIAGLIGRSRFVYDVWGETVNLASRIEAAGTPGRIHLSEATRALLRDAGGFEARTSELRGVGAVRTFLAD